VYHRRAKHVKRFQPCFREHVKRANGSYGDDYLEGQRKSGFVHWRLNEPVALCDTMSKVGLSDLHLEGECKSRAAHQSGIITRGRSSVG
jgi:hypothetical protein